MDQTKLKMLVLLHATKVFAICQHINLIDCECSKSSGKSVQSFIALFHFIQKNSVIWTIYWNKEIFQAVYEAYNLESYIPSKNLKQNKAPSARAESTYTHTSWELH